MAIKKIPSVVPYYATGAFWLLYGLILPMYRTMDFVIVAVLSVGVFFLCKKVFPGKEITVELPPERTGDEDLDEVVMQVYDSVKKMHLLNEEIRNEKISKQIGELESLTGKILDAIKEEPRKINQVQTFLNYYLPTTIKLLTAYRDLAAQSADSKNIKSSMDKIENVMDTILDGYRKELDGLFLGKAMDIAAEINIIESMMDSQNLKS